MRHLKTQRKLGRNSAHRKAMYRNMVTSLLEHERINTTLAKAKELRGHVERCISVSVRLGDLLDKPKAERSREEQMKVVAAMGRVARTVKDRDVLHKLFEDIAPRIRARGANGGYTRIYRTGRRVGDAAETAIIELVIRDAKATKAADEKQVDAEASHESS